MSDDKAEEFLKTLDRINSIFPIDKNLFVMYWQFFKDFEDSPIIMDYLVNHKEIQIDQIKNTKSLFHEIIYFYMINMARNQNTTFLDEIQKTELNIQIREATKILVEISQEQEAILKLPTIEERRNPKLIEEKLKKENAPT